MENVNIREIARLSGVSISTVSRVLNGYRNVNSETRDRVLRAIEETGYSQRRSKPPVSRTVGIILPLDEGKSIDAHPTLHTVLSGVTHRLAELNIGNTLVMLGDDDKGSELPGVPADAYIIFGTTSEQEDELIPNLVRRGIPLVAINRWLNEKRVSYVNIDDSAAAFQAVERLIGLGHVKIGIVNGNPQNRNSQLRHAGYLSAMEKHGLPVREEWVIYGRYSEESGKAGAKKVAALPDAVRPTALFTTSDVIALGLQKGFLKAGYSLPDDMSVIGFGDIELASYINPPLTTVRMPAYEMGVQAAETAERLLRGDTIRHIKILVESKLVIRGSDKPLK